MIATAEKLAPPPALTQFDRCDACGTTEVQAVVRYWHPQTGAVLDLCGHHARKHWLALVEHGYRDPAAEPADTIDSDPATAFQMLLLRNGATLREPD